MSITIHGCDKGRFMLRLDGEISPQHWGLPERSWAHRAIHMAWQAVCGPDTLFDLYFEDDRVYLSGEGSEYTTEDLVGAESRYKEALQLTLEMTREEIMDVALGDKVCFDMKKDLRSRAKLKQDQEQ